MPDIKALGHSTLNHFLLDKDWKNFNHGGYGTHPSEVRDELRKFQDQTEARPDQFIRYEYPKLLDASRKAIADYVNAPVNEIVYVKSATVGINAVLRNLSYGPQDIIIYFSTIFDACENSIKSVMETTTLEARKIDVLLPASHNDIVLSFLQTVDQAKREGFNVRIALFDTISSNPGVRLPFEKLVEVCREYRILSLVDGAHGVGQIPLDLGKLGADFFVSIIHKWGYTPRGCTVFHVPIRNQHLIGTAMPTSHIFIPKDKLSATAPIRYGSKSAFEMMFENVAATDSSAYLTVPAALRYRSRLPGGEDGIRKYIRDIAFRGGNLVAQILGTDVIEEPNSEPTAPCNLRNCALANVRLPFMISDQTPGDPGITSDWPVISTPQAQNLAKQLQSQLVANHSTFASIFVHNSALWIRLSGQIYLELEDFGWLGQVLKSECGNALTS